MSRFAFLVSGKSLWFLILLVILLQVFAEQPAFGAEAVSAPEGQWSGKIETPGPGLEITVDLWSADEGLAGVISIPAQGLTRFPLGDVTSSDGETSFAMSGIPGDPRFVGTLTDGVLGGTFTQGPNAFPFKLQRTGDADRGQAVEEAAPLDAATAKPYLGTWKGVLNVPGNALRMVFHLKLDDTSRLTGTVDSPDQGTNDMPISRGTVSEGTLRLEMTYLQASYEATISEDGSTLAGTWKQGPGSLPLELTRGE